MKVVVERTWLEDLDKRSILGGQRTCEALGTGNIKTWRCGQGKSNLTIYAWYGGDQRGESQRFVHPQTQCFTFGCSDIPRIAQRAKFVAENACSREQLSIK